MFLRLITLTLLSLCNFVYAESATESASDVISEQALDSYYNSLNKQIQMQEERVNKLLDRMKKGVQIPSQIQRVEIEHAIVMLDVKRTLYANFYNTESLKQSRAVRNMLSRLMSQNEITVSDLSALQNLVKQEKQRLGIQ